MKHIILITVALFIGSGNALACGPRASTERKDSSALKKQAQEKAKALVASTNRTQK
jgi:hypothetical protein